MFDNAFWENVSRYPRYFVAIILGVFLNAFGWVTPLLKHPISAIALIGFVLGTITFVTLTLRAMLGLAPV